MTIIKVELNDSTPILSCVRTVHVQLHTDNVNYLPERFLVVSIFRPNFEVFVNSRLGSALSDVYS